MSVSLHQFWIVMGLTTIAGLATGIGGLLAFFSRPGKDNGRFISATLGFYGGVRRVTHWSENTVRRTADCWQCWRWRQAW